MRGAVDVTKSRTMRPLALLALCCCGGSPAAPFLGTWAGTQSLTFTPDISGSAPITSNGVAIEETLSENLNTGDVDFSSCRMSGRPDGDKLTLYMMAAPCRVTDGSCSVDLTIATGGVVVRGNAMTLDYGGTAVRLCSGVETRGTYSAHANLTRR